MVIIFLDMCTSNVQNVRPCGYYWLYVHVGTIGWYAEITGDETSAIMEKIEAIASGKPDYVNKIGELVPRNRRISMPTPN